MHISDSMLVAARKSAPELSDDRIRALLREVMKESQLLFRTDEGKAFVEGKAEWPVLLQVQVTDPLQALELAQQLMEGAKRALLGDTGARAMVTLSLAGDAMISE